MNDKDYDGELEAFDAALREWAVRPAGRSAEAALRAATAAPAKRTVGARWWLPAAVVATVLVAAAGVWLTSGRAPDAFPPRLAAAAARPLDDNVVLWWIDPDTPVYFVLDAGKPGKGGVS